MKKTDNISYNLHGLDARQVLESRAKYGANVLTPAKRKPWWVELLEKFRDPLIVILLIAGILSVCISIYEYYALGQGAAVFFEPVGIFVAILLATGLAFLFENNANKAFRILNTVSDDDPVKVLRADGLTTVPRRDIVVGDVVMLNTGDEIPADGKLVEASMLNVDESSLTGEPVAAKTYDPEHFDKNATYPSDYVLRGTKVMEGHAKMVVEKVGDATEMGKVFEDVQIDDSVKTPLSEQFDRLSRLISMASYIVGILIVVARMVGFLCTEWVSGDWVSLITYSLQTLMVAVTLIVVAVPEGLPMAVTLSLAYSMRRMLKTNNLVRKMHACETMGATTVICTDKTGTLTQNRMQVEESRFGVPESEMPRIYESIAVNSTASLDRTGKKPEPMGNPTEGALLLWLDDRGVDYAQLQSKCERIAEIPFSTERKYMATVVKSSIDVSTMLYVKGAPEIVLSLCSNIAGDVSQKDIEEQLLKYQDMGMRTLGFAMARVDSAEDAIRDNKIVAKNLTFTGIVAISDPVRNEVPGAVDECLSAGIRVKIVTGDTPATARNIGHRIGLWKDTDTDESIITGPEFAALTDEELAERVGTLKIIARARPTDKKRLVEALQARGEVVAVTGDGTNDAPALRQAHVGLSMGDGTSVAKEASDITIIDNSFSSIGKAVMWGRSLYRNIQRFLLFQLTVNVAACLLVLVGSFMGTTSPLTVTQMLWVNLIMDTFGAMALASLPPSQSVMKEKPRDRRKSILTPGMAYELGAVGFIFFAITAWLYWVFNHAEVTSILDIFSIHLGDYQSMTTVDATLLFSVFVWTHFWYMFDARAYATNESVFRLKMGKGFWTIVATIIAGQLFITEIAYEFFNVEPMLHTLDWKFNPTGALNLAIIFVGSSLVVWVREFWLLLSRK